jgi:hypothetical protein
MGEFCYFGIELMGTRSRFLKLIYIFSHVFKVNFLLLCPFHSSKKLPCDRSKSKSKKAKRAVYVSCKQKY